MAETMLTIARRKTTRNFVGALPEMTAIAEIAKTVMLAPYGGATGIPRDEGRKVFIFPPNTMARTEAVNLIHGVIRKNAFRLRWLLKCVPWLRRKMRPFSARLDTIAAGGIPGFRQATYFVVVAERKGFPPVEKQSLAHAMQNMWLAATDMGLGFQLVSATGLMAGNRAFLKPLGLDGGKWALDGCLIGAGADPSHGNRETPTPASYTVIA